MQIQSTVSKVGVYTEIVNLASEFRAFGADPHQDVELPNEESMHPGINQLYMASALARQKIIMMDFPRQENDPVRVIQLLIVICVSLW